MKLQDIVLLEKRRNADHPAQKKHYDSQMFDKYRDLPPEEIKQLYVSFTEIDKLGVNPMSNYNTPIGIYTYPLSYVMRLDRPSHVPFAGGNANMWVVKAVDSVLSLNDYDNLREDQIKAQRYLTELLKDSDVAIGIVNNAIATAHVSVNSNASRFWNIARKVAETLNKIETKRRYDQKNSRKLSNDTIAFNTVLRKVFGYTVVADHNLGIIHPNEPTQCVFLTKAALKVVDKLANRRFNYDPARGPHPLIEEKKKFDNQLGSGLEDLDRVERMVEREVSKMKSRLSQNTNADGINVLLVDLRKLMNAVVVVADDLLSARNGYWEDWKKKKADEFDKKHNCTRRVRKLINLISGLEEDIWLKELGA